MIKEKLLQKDYYLSKMSMFMKESYGVDVNVDLMLDWMKSIDSASTYLTNVLDIWNPNYKNDMIEKFGFKYIYRALDETSFYLRGNFEDTTNNKEISISNVYVKLDNIDYSVESANADDTSFYAVIKSQDTEFESGDKYFKLNIDENYTLTKTDASPVVLGLYEETSSGSATKKAYKPSQDTEFETDKDYYTRTEVGLYRYDYYKTYPKALGLYEGNIYKFNYNVSDTFSETSPSEMNLSWFEEIAPQSTSTFDNNQYRKVQAYEGFYNYILATPKTANNGNPLYEGPSTPYTPTDDDTFVSGKTYYMTTQGGVATPGECGLHEMHNAINGDKFTDYTWWEFYQNAYQEAYSFNLMVNTYHLSVTFKNSSDSNFNSSKKYYKLKDSYTVDEVEEITSSLSIDKVVPDGKIYKNNGQQLNTLPFTANAKYYKNTGKKDRVVPNNLRLLELKDNKYVYSSDDNFESNKTYYVIKEANPSLLGLYEYVSREYIQSTDTSFDSSKTYYSQSGNRYYEANPSNIGLTEKEINTIISSSSDGKSFNYENYYTNQSFNYAKYETSSFGTPITLKKIDSNYESDKDIVIENGNGEDFKALDVIASIVGCSRKNKIIYEKDDKLVEEMIDLSNEDLLDLIKIKIIQNNYKGTLREIIDLYKEKLYYQIFISLIPISTDENNPSYKSAACNVYLTPKKSVDNEVISENMQKLFLYSDIFIESLGIAYNRTIVPDIDNILWLNRDYSFKNEKAIYSITEKGEPEKRDTSTRLG